MTSLLLLIAFFGQLNGQNTAPVPAHPSPAKYSTSPSVDRNFAVVATQSANAEMDGAHLALKQAAAGEVISFAKKMMEEHAPMTQDFQPVIAPLLPSTPLPRLAPADQLALQHLESLPAVDFDQEYLMGQISGHLATLAVLQSEADNGTNPRLKELARKWLPTVKAHLELAVYIARHAGGSSPFKGN